MFLQSTDQLAGGVEVRAHGDGDFNLSYVTFLDLRRTGVAARAACLASATRPHTSAPGLP